MSLLKINSLIHTGGVTNNMTFFSNGSVSFVADISNVNQIFVGSNSYVNSTTHFVGNSTVNASHTSTLLQVSNSTSTANLTALDLKIGATTVVNSTQVTATLFTGNLTASYANVSGQVNTATLYATTSANIASIVQANTSGLFSTSTLSGANLTSTTNTTTIGTAVYFVSNGNIGISNSAPANKLSVNGTTFLQGNLTLGNSSVAVAVIANNSAGTSGQFLTSNGTAVYWSTIASAPFDLGLAYAYKAITF